MDSEPSAKQQELQSLASTDATATTTSKNAQTKQEYLLQGSILDSSVEVLLHRLRGLCDNTDSGAETFHDHEACFMLPNVASNQPAQPLTFRVRKALDDGQSPWHLRYMGQPELGDKNRPTMVRNVVDVGCGGEIVEFLKELGCRREFDYVTKGFVFRKGRLKIIVGKIFNAHGMDPVSNSNYVEMSVVTPFGQDIIGEDMKILAEQLKPLVNLDKVDHRRLP